MKWRAWLVDGLAAAAAGMAIFLFAALRVAPRTSAEASAPEPEAVWSRLQSEVGVLREVLAAQPDVRNAEVVLFTPERRPPLAVVSLDWTTPTVPPPKRLETVALWCRERLSAVTPCDVHVVDPARRYLLSRDGGALEGTGNPAVPRIEHE